MQEKLKDKIKNYFQWFLYTKIKPKGGPQSNAQKQKLILKVAQENKIKVFIETGTYIGETVNAVLPYFEEIYTIELNKKLYFFNRKRFKNDRKVTILLGDSSTRLKEILPKIKVPSLFWLDAHYSGGITSKTKNNTPVNEELKVIKKHWISGNIILIDDARLFNGTNGYPTLNKIEKILSPIKLKTKVKSDIIIIK